MVLTIPSPRSSLVSRLSPAAVAATAVQIPSAYVSLVHKLVVGGGHALFPAASAPPEAEESESEETSFFESTSPPSGLGTPPPNYTTSPPTPQPTFSEPVPLPLSQPTSLTQVVSAAPCTSCSHMQLQLHLLSLQNEAYLAQRDYLLRHQSLPQPESSSGSSGSSGLLGFVIATFIRAMFLVAFVLWPYVKRLLGRMREWEREWEVAGRVSNWGWRMVGMTWGVVMTARKDNPIGISRKGVGAGWELMARRGLEEVVVGVTEGVRDGLVVWGVNLEV